MKFENNCKTHYILSISIHFLQSHFVAPKMVRIAIAKIVPRKPLTIPQPPPLIRSYGDHKLRLYRQFSSAERAALDPQLRIQMAQWDEAEQKQKAMQFAIRLAKAMWKARRVAKRKALWQLRDIPSQPPKLTCQQAGLYDDEVVPPILCRQHATASWYSDADNAAIDRINAELKTQALAVRALRK